MEPENHWFAKDNRLASFHEELWNLSNLCHLSQTGGPSATPGMRHPLFSLWGRSARRRWMRWLSILLHLLSSLPLCPLRSFWLQGILQILCRRMPQLPLWPCASPLLLVSSGPQGPFSWGALWAPSSRARLSLSSLPLWSWSWTSLTSPYSLFHVWPNATQAG